MPTSFSLLIKFSKEFDQAVLVSLKNALKRSIEVAFQLDSSEIMAEIMPNEERGKALLFYESAEGGAGVLSRLVESTTDVRQIGETALRASLNTMYARYNIIKQLL